MQKSSNSTNSTHRNTYLYKGLRTFLFRSFTAIWLFLCLNFFSHKARLTSNWAADCVFILFERIWTNVTLFVNGRKKAEAKMMLIQMGCFLFSIWFRFNFLFVTHFRKSRHNLTISENTLISNSSSDCCQKKINPDFRFECEIFRIWIGRSGSKSLT